ncbi:class I adenylate-forming enzyme family protein [Fodinicola acaciae]|uniref:class I adenylate-forming enzyme family protein n=1 Tax=Fodinicola acaciae TaxID=2681555 RepID=UPI0013D0DC6C|nr:fatty acid--CoA ligase family protein [Fodinicola acaciae]
MESVFPQALLDALEQAPDTPAFELGARVVSRGELLELIGRMVAGFRAAGLGQGSGVGIATGVTAEGFAAIMAANTLGCRVVGVRAGLTPKQLRHVVGSDLAALVVDDAAATEELLSAADGAKVLRIGPELLSSYEKPVAGGRPEDVAQVLFTSGSTGDPKGVVFSYAGMSVHWSWQPARWSPVTAELATGYRRFLLFGTLFSAVMQEHLALCLLSGGTAVVPAGLPDFPWIIERLRISACLLTVPRLHRVLDVLRTRTVDLSTLRMLKVAGSPLAPHRRAEAFERIGSAMREGYGQSEIGVLTWLTAQDVRRWPHSINSVGRPVAEIDVEIRDQDGNPVPTGTVGEIFVRAPYALVGYWRDLAETAEVLVDGWVRTRDLGHLDEDGFLYLTGRTRDVIIVNAIIHYAGPIEQVLASHPDVDQAYVVGAPDERTGEAAHAFLVAAGDREPDLDELRTLVAAELGEAAVPATMTLVAHVPTLPSGKPDKKGLLSALRLS